MNYGPGRHWNHGRNSYFAVMLGLVGAFMTIGAVARLYLPWLIGALCVLASPLAIIRSDAAARKNEDGSRHTPLRIELLWLLVATLLVVGGVTVFGISA